MSATGLDVFDTTLKTTHIWLDEIMAELKLPRPVAWHVLGGVLRTVRDRLPLGLAAHLGAQLPLLVRGLYYEQWRPTAEESAAARTHEPFLERVGEALATTRPIDSSQAARAVFKVLGRHLSAGQVEKIRNALPDDTRALWSISGAAEAILSD